MEGVNRIRSLNRRNRMQRHTKIYFEFFGYGVGDYIPCEIPNCGKTAVDVCHIDARGMGGNPSGSKDVIENLMGKCRSCHEEYGDKKDVKDWLREVHKEFMNKFGIKK